MGKFEPAGDSSPADSSGREGDDFQLQTAGCTTMLDSVPSKRETARGQRAESKSPESLETLKSTTQIGIGVLEAGLVLMRSAEPAPWSKRTKASFRSAPVLLRKLQNDDPTQKTSA